MPDKKIVIVAGETSHGPAGNGIHDYALFAKLIKALLDQSPNISNIDVSLVFNGWPEDESVFESADSIVFITDGKDGDKFSPAPFCVNPERFELMNQQVQRGCGFVSVHFSTFLTNDEGEQVIDWNGGYFKWEDEKGERNWYSSINRKSCFIELPSPGHELSHGLVPFMLYEEYYHNIKFKNDDPRLIPIWNAPELPDLKSETGGIVSWGLERENGRGFVTTCGHDLGKFAIDQFRKMLLNGIVWSTGLSVPANGVTSDYIPVHALEEN